MPRRKSRPIRHRQYKTIDVDTPDELKVASAKFVKLFRRDPILRRVASRDTKLEYVKSVCERVWGCEGETVFEEDTTETLYICGGNGQFIAFTADLNPWYAGYVVQVFKMTFPRLRVEEGRDGFSVNVPPHMY